MEMQGEYRIAAPRAQVWEALNDPEILKASIPGCEELERTSDTEMTAKVRAKVGPVSARFTGKVTLSEVDPPNGYRIDGEGTGGAAGFAKGGAAVALKEDGDGTLLSYDVTATVGGKLAQIGSRLIDSTAKKMADDFFKRFSALAAGEASPEEVAEPPAVEVEPETQPEPQATATTSPETPPAAANDEKPGGVNWIMWGTIGVIGLLLLIIVLS
jgi:uncharacterized protein